MTIEISNVVRVKVSGLLPSTGTWIHLGEMKFDNKEVAEMVAEDTSGHIANYMNNVNTDKITYLECLEFGDSLIQINAFCSFKVVVEPIY